MPPRRRGWLRQFVTLTKRYASVIAKDRRFLLLLALQAPLLGLIMWRALPSNTFTPSANPVRFSSAAIVLTVVFSGVTWLGLSNAVREIVKESSVFRRERAAGLSASAYVASKAVVLGIITAVQAIVLTAIATADQGSGWGPAAFEPAQLELAAAAAATGVAAMALGLLLSAWVKTVERATALLPLLLLLQLLLSGGFKDVVEEPPLREASYAASAQWGFSAGAATVDLNRLQVFNDCLFASAPSGDLDAKDVELTLLCVRVGLGESDAFESLETFVVATGVMSAAEVADAMDRLGPISVGDESNLEQLLSEFAPDGTTQSELDRMVEVFSARGRLRFWDQTREHWVINMSVLGGFTVISLLGAWILLARRQRSVPS
jgi:hypothetical protein